MAKRVTARVPDDVNDKLDVWYQRLGLSKSQLAGISIQAGLGHILRAVSPEEAISPEVLAKILKAAEAEGINIEDGKKL